MDGSRDIMLTEISQRKTNTILFHSYVKFKKENKQRQKQQINQKPDSTIENKLMVTRGEMGKTGEGD